jgi:cytosine permease
MDKRAAWYKTTAQTYAGIMLWFAFWQTMVWPHGPGEAGTLGGRLAAGILPALAAIVVAALICHFLFYLVPGLLGMKTGLPLYIVGTSTYGVQGGFVMPGFVMGLLQFCWLAFNAFFVSDMLCTYFEIGLGADGKVAVPGAIHGVIAAVWAILAAFVGLKGIQYLARVATYLPLIPLVVLIVLFVKTAGGVGNFEPKQVIDATKAKAAVAAEKAKAEGEEAPEEPKAPLGGLTVFLVMVGGIVGFFATAGAAGTDIASSNRDAKDVQLGGLTGIALATVFAAGLAVLIVAGAYGAGLATGESQGELNPVKLMGCILGSKQTAAVLAILLAISSFPPACFSAFIAANSFKTTLPKVNPFVSVGIGTIAAIIMGVTGVAGKATFVFDIIGASFGPVCGAMVADYLLSGGKWAGPRAGLNPAGWISWVVGAAVGAYNMVAPYIPALKELQFEVPVAPVAAFVVGFVLYFLLAKAGLQSKGLEMPRAAR